MGWKIAICNDGILFDCILHDQAKCPYLRGETAIARPRLGLHSKSQRTTWQNPPRPL